MIYDERMAKPAEPHERDENPMNRSLHHIRHGIATLGVGVAMTSVSLLGWAAVASAAPTFLPGPTPNPITQTLDPHAPGTVWTACINVGTHNPNSSSSTYHSSPVGSTIFEGVGSTFCLTVF